MRKTSPASRLYTVQEPPTPTPRSKCPTGHELAAFETPEDGFLCSLCDCPGLGQHKACPKPFCPRRDPSVRTPLGFLMQHEPPMGWKLHETRRLTVPCRPPTRSPAAVVSVWVGFPQILASLLVHSSSFSSIQSSVRTSPSDPRGQSSQPWERLYAGSDSRRGSRAWYSVNPD